MLDFRLVSCLEKVFIDEAPAELKYAPEGLIGEPCAFQAAWSETITDSVEYQRRWCSLEIDSPIRDCIRVYAVRQAPVRFASITDSDDGYLRHKRPGLYPDPLEVVPLARLRVFAGQWEAVWIEINTADELPAGDYPITVRLKVGDNEPIEKTTVYHRIGAKLPEQELIHTHWFHNDGICTFYRVKMFSEQYWKICREFVKAAVDMSVNCLLTPIHTPPLDTAVGGERLTCQLVDIEKNGDEYTFGFDRLERWVKMALECGIEYFEIAHLFSQWGAAYAPKIMAKVNGRTRRIFGWNTPGTGDEYVSFLNQYVPAVRQKLTELGVIDRCLFHISDEPSLAHLDNYMKARKAVEKALEGLPVIDALSNIELYEAGAVKNPVPATDHIKPFLRAGIKGLWCYYCIGQHEKVSNAFIADPSHRTRIIGVQMYKYDIAGFLQWGFNFYNSQYSEYPVNPYLSTDGDGFGPAGDAFIVYPGMYGKPLQTLRSRVFNQAVCDMRALKMLESLAGREFVMGIIEDGISPIEFDSYPESADYLFDLRHRVNAEIEKRI